MLGYFCAPTCICPWIGINVNVEERLEELEAMKKYLCIDSNVFGLDSQQKLFIESLVYGLELLFFPAFSLSLVMLFL